MQIAATIFGALVGAIAGTYTAFGMTLVITMEVAKVIAMVVVAGVSMGIQYALDSLCAPRPQQPTLAQPNACTRLAPLHPCCMRAAGSVVCAATFCGDVAVHHLVHGGNG